MGWTATDGVAVLGWILGELGRVEERRGIALSRADPRGIRIVIGGYGSISVGLEGAMRR